MVWTPEEIKSFKERHKLTADNMATLLGINRSYVFLLLKGQKTPSDMLSRLLNCLEKALGWTFANEPRYEIFNLGESRPVELNRLLALIETALGKKARVEPMPMQAGDVQRTYADLTKSTAQLGYRPTMCIEEGIESFVRWYREKNHKSEFSV